MSRMRRKLAEAESDQILAEIKSHTGLDNPNSRNQLIEWCQARKYPYDSLDKEHIEEALKSGTPTTPAATHCPRVETETRRVCVQET